MSQQAADYYAILDADERTSRSDLERLYKRKASRLHPDKGGSEESMKALNEAYCVLKDETRRREYDAKRKPNQARPFVPTAATPARDIGAFGHFLTAFLCLLVGLFLLFLVRFQWIWFLWPLAILSIFVIFFGVLMARSATAAYQASLSVSNPLRRRVVLRETIFWAAVLSSGYGIYIILTALE